MALRVKDPGSVNEPFGHDWTAWLAEIADDEVIAESEWSIVPSGLTVTNESIVVGSRKTQLRVSGGVVNTKYTLTNRITTNTGIEDERSFVLVVQDR